MTNSTYPQRNSAEPGGFTAAQHNFAMIPSANIPRSVLNRSCGLKTTFDSGYLIPIFVDEALPGDTCKLQTTGLVRLTTQAAPFMDNLYLDLFYFAVPYRLIWDNWQKFNGEQVDPGDSTAFLVPQMTETVASGSLSDYMGIPIGNTLTFNSLHHRAANLIWNEWFRDENLQDSLVVDTDDGPDNPADYVLQRRGKRHDYFSSCLPFTQKGPAVELPLGTSNVVGDATATPVFSFLGATGGSPSALGVTTAADNIQTMNNITGAAGPLIMSWVDPGLEVDTTAATINQIREAFQVQKLLERDARGGSRYTEIVRSHFGVISPDQRLQRPEYLGGGSTRITVQPVATTAYNGAQPFNGVGYLRSFAVGTSVGQGFMKSFTEHCLLLGFANVRADITYQQGLNRMFSRQTRYDYYWPAFAHLGEQAVLNKEIYADGSANDDLVFGYQERWAEYRYKPSITTGLMRSDAAASLDIWHLGLDFASLPALNATFIEDNPPVDRIVTVPTEPDWRADFFFNFRCARPMPTYSVPGLVDHF